MAKEWSWSTVEKNTVGWARPQSPSSKVELSMICLPKSMRLRLILRKGRHQRSDSSFGVVEPDEELLKMVLEATITEVREFLQNDIEKVRGGSQRSLGPSSYWNKSMPVGLKWRCPIHRPLDYKSQSTLDWILGLMIFCWDRTRLCVNVVRSRILID